MIRSLCFTPEDGLRTDLQTQDLPAILQNPAALIWVDLANEPAESAESVLTGIFHFHPLAVDDALIETHIPKVDDWGDYLYIVLHALAFQPELTVCTQELDIFLGHNFIVTHHDEAISSIQKIWETCLRDKRYLSNGPDHLLYKMIDDVVADYMPMVETLDEKIDQIEDEVLEKPTPNTLQRIFTLKRALQTMRRVITPQREVMNKLARDDYEVIDPRDRVFFRDVYDHLVRMHDLNESMRDLVTGTLDIYLSVVNNRMNDVMKTLTVITTLFMPISFVTGFFGMNFFEAVAGLTGWTDRVVFFIVLSGMVAVPIGMYRWMKTQTWV